MTGTVHMINRRRGLVAIKADAGAFTVAEMTGSDPISLGDRVEWHGTEAGVTTYFNQTKAARFAVNVHAHRVPESRVRQQLRLRKLSAEDVKVLKGEAAYAEKASSNLGVDAYVGDIDGLREALVKGVGRRRRQEQLNPPRGPDLGGPAGSILPRVPPRCGAGLVECGGLTPLWLLPWM